MFVSRYKKLAVDHCPFWELEKTMELQKPYSKAAWGQDEKLQKRGGGLLKVSILSDLYWSKAFSNLDSDQRLSFNLCRILLMKNREARIALGCSWRTRVTERLARGNSEFFTSISSRILNWIMKLHRAQMLGLQSIFSGSKVEGSWIQGQLNKILSLSFLLV